MKELIKRWQWRTLLPFAIVAAMFSLMQWLTELTGIPELPRVMPAVAVLFMLEWLLMVRRAIFNPKIDFQSMVIEACQTPEGAAAMAKMYAWGTVLRLGVLMCVIYFS